MLAEVRVPYRVDETRHYPRVNDQHVRYASFGAEVTYAFDDVAPVVLTLQARDHRIEYRKYGGKLHRALGFDVHQLDGLPLPVLFYVNGTVTIHEAMDAFPEEEGDIACGGEWRTASIRGAKHWTSKILIGPDDIGVISELRPVEEPLIAVVPPGDTFGGFSGAVRRKKKRPGLKVILEPDWNADEPEFLAALREDRLFRVDEADDAMLRAADFGDRPYAGRYRFEERDTSCFKIELSTMALRLTAKEAVQACPRLRRSSLRPAKQSLLEVIGQPEANAAAICPHVRSFIASFGENAESFAISQSPEVAPYLKRLQQAHDRAQKRMAAQRIPSIDPRELAPEDVRALGMIAQLV